MIINRCRTLLLSISITIIASGCGSSNIGSTEDEGGTNNSNQNVQRNTSINDLKIETPAPGSPVIDLNGANPEVIQQGERYSEPGASAHDAEDGDISGHIEVDTSNVDSNQLGSYNVVYRVEDSNNNDTSKTRKVQVVSEPLIPSNRKTDWSPGISLSLPVSTTTINVKDYGALGNGSGNDATAIQQAIDSLPEAGGTIYIPEGTYSMRSPLTIENNNIFLKGDGRNKTRLKFNYNQKALAAIIFTKNDATGWKNIVGGYAKGSSEITVPNSSIYSTYKYLEIQQSNDPSKMYTRSQWNQKWGHDGVGEIVKIRSIQGDKITLEEPLSHNYRSGLSPELRGVGLIEFGGVENLYIELTKNTNAHTFWINKAAYISISNIESNMTSRGHVNLWSSYKCEVINSHFHHSHDYGGGGHGYGVQLMRHTTGCLIQNNTFHDLRHSMILSIGPTANVFAYNYSHLNRSQTAAKLADIALHGYYASYNLFEGNVVQEIGIADYWGPAGPGNTFLRNCVAAENFEVRDSSHDQNLIGNIMIGSSNKIDIKAGVTGTFLHGNQSSNGVISWNKSIEDRIIPGSYYLQKKPGFFGASTWPITICLIPAFK